MPVKRIKKQNFTTQKSRKNMVLFLISCEIKIYNTKADSFFVKFFI